MERIKDLREDKNITQEKIAEILKIKRSTYTSYEIERDTIPLKHLITLANYFDVSIDYVFGFTNKMRYPNMKKDIDLKIIGSRLKEIRVQNKITQYEIAEILNTSRSTWTNYERGINLISNLILYDFAKRYKVSADYLLGRIDTKIKLKIK